MRWLRKRPEGREALAKAIARDWSRFPSRRMRYAWGGSMNTCAVGLFFAYSFRLRAGGKA